MNSEGFTICVKTVGSESSPFIYSIHWFCTGVAWHFDLVVLNDVLLDNGVSIAEGRSLCNGIVVEVSLGDETIVAWDVSCSFCGSHGELVVLVALRLSIRGKLDARVVTVGADGSLELGLIVAALGRVSLTVITPDWAGRNRYRGCHLRFICHLFVGLPVLGGVAKALSTSCS